MTDPLKEQISACLDGELPEVELDLLLKRLGRDSLLRQDVGRAMGSYALIGEAMRAERPVTASTGFAARVSAAVREEAVPPAERLPNISHATLRWMKPAVGVAIAAGVAAVAVMAVQPAAPEYEQIAIVDNATENAANDSSAPSSYTVPINAGSNANAFVPAARLTNYVVAHSEYSSPLGRRTVLSGVLSDDDRLADEAEVSSVEDASQDSQDLQP